MKRCQHEKTQIINSRKRSSSERIRRHECLQCGYRYSTLEIALPTSSGSTVEEQFVARYLGLTIEQLHNLEELIGNSSKRQ